MNKLKVIFTGIYSGVMNAVDVSSTFLRETFGKFTDLAVLIIGLFCLSFIAPAIASALVWWFVLISIYIFMFRIIWNAFSGTSSTVSI